MRTFWKTSPISLGEKTDKVVTDLLDPNDHQHIVATHLAPLGPVNEVCQVLLTIPKTFACFDAVDQRCISLLWAVDQGVILSFKTEEEFGPGGVFSILAKSRVSEKAFFRLYVQVYERFGTILLDDSGNFIEIKAFKKRCE